jgi:catechol 2,3-dioxygenase-like lactoylglutathione lyase family enzyme
MAEPSLRFSHMGFTVHDQPKMERFYRDLLGFTVTDRGELPGPDGKPVSLVFLSRDPNEHHQIVLAAGRPAQLAHNPINQISLRTDDLTSLVALYRRFRDAGVDDMNPVTHGNAVSLYFRDPEGNRIEVYIDTPWYVSQPMRVPVNMEQDEAAIMRDIEAHARTLPGFRPIEEWRDEVAARMAEHA